MIIAIIALVYFCICTTIMCKMWISFEMLIYLHSAGWERIFSQSPTVPHVAHKIQPSCDEGEGYDLSCYDLITMGFIELYGLWPWEGRWAPNTSYSTNPDEEIQRENSRNSVVFHILQKLMINTFWIGCTLHTFCIMHNNILINKCNGK